MMAYRSTVQETSNCTPNLLMFGRETRLPIDIMFASTIQEKVPNCPCEYVEWVKDSMSLAFENVKLCTNKNALRQKRNYDTGRELRKFKIGDWVWVHYPPNENFKFGQGWHGPFLIVNKLSELNYRVQKSENSRIITVHIDHIKQYDHEVPDSWLNLA
jgi:ribosomal protein L21E